VTAPTVSVIVPSLLGRRLLAECLGGLDRATVEAETVVVDNGWTDRTADWLASEHPTVRVIHNARNVGFAAAINQGIRATTGRWVALLNDDATAEPGWLAALVRAADSDPRIGAVASRMMFRDSPDVVCSAGVRVDSSYGAWDLLVGSRAWPAAPVEVFGASAGACLLRRAMLDDVGPLEETFFAYLEDVDLAWRARLRGWRAVLAPDAVVAHGVSATAGEGSQLKRYLLARNKWLTIVRCVPWSLLAAHLPIVAAYDALSQANSLAHGDASSLRGRMAAASVLPRLVRERRVIQARRTADDHALRGALSALESPLTLHRRARLVARLAAPVP
jgi:GT2 family glycosyltransferase